MVHPEKRHCLKLRRKIDKLSREAIERFKKKGWYIAFDLELIMFLKDHTDIMMF